MHLVKSTAPGPLRSFTVTCENTRARVKYDITVFAKTQHEASWLAREYIEANNLVRAERMVTSVPGTHPTREGAAVTPRKRDIPAEAAAFDSVTTDDSQNEPPDFDVDDDVDVGEPRMTAERRKALRLNKWRERALKAEAELRLERERAERLEQAAREVQERFDAWEASSFKREPFENLVVAVARLRGRAGRTREGGAGRQRPRNQRRKTARQYEPNGWTK